MTRPHTRPAAAGREEAHRAASTTAQVPPLPRGGYAVVMAVLALVLPLALAWPATGLAGGPVLTAAVGPASGAAATASSEAPSETPAEETVVTASASPRLDIVVRLDRSSDYSIEDLGRDFPVRLVDDVLASRLLYLVRATDPRTARDESATKELARDMERHDGVLFAELDPRVVLADEHYHSWPAGRSTPREADLRDFRRQPLARELRLKRVHRLSTGRGVLVAVLDTGIARRHPVLAGRFRGGYDYVDDDERPVDRARNLDSNDNDVPDEAYGHGSFVAGLVALIAPEARIMPLRVLDSDGQGSVYLVALAVWEAVERGADVINLSLGAPDEVGADVLQVALDHAREHDVEVVAAAGNDATDDKTFPAQAKHVTAVSSVEVGRDRLSKFANWGDWVQVAAPAGRLLGPVPRRGYARWAGTSMAAPQVSAQIALLIAAGATRSDRHDLVYDTSREFEDAQGRTLRHGIVDPLASLRALAAG